MNKFLCFISALAFAALSATTARTAPQVSLSFGTATTGFGTAALDQAYLDFFGFPRGSGQGGGLGFSPQGDDDIALRTSHQLALRIAQPLAVGPRMQATAQAGAVIGRSHFHLKDGFGLFIDPTDLRFAYGGIELALTADRVWHLPHDSVLTVGGGAGVGRYRVMTRLDSALLDIDSPLITTARYVQAQMRLEKGQTALWAQARYFATQDFEFGLGVELLLHPKR